MSEELKPCPMCGSSTDPAISSCFNEHHVECMNCQTSGPMGFDEDDAIEQWNTRHIPEGYALVPVEPTKAMERAFWDWAKNNDWLDSHKMYKTMIAAAQEIEK